MTGRFLLVVGMASSWLLTGCGKSSHETAAKSSAYVEVSPAILDAGDVWPGQIVEKAVNLSNRHPSAVILISGIQTSCSCTVTTLEKRQLAPGETVTAKVAMTFGEALGDAGTSAAFKWQTVDAGETAQGVAQVRISGRVVDLVQMFGTSIYLGEVRKGQGPARGEFRVGLGNSGETLDAIKLRTTVSAFTGECIREESGGFVLKYQFDPEHLPIGSFQEPVDLVLFDGNSERGVRRIHLLGSVKGGVRASPPTVMFTSLEKGKVASEVVRIRAEREGDVLAVNGKIDVQNKLVDVEEASRSNSEVELRISIRLSEDKLPDGSGVSDTVSIPISVNGIEEVLKVPILGFPLGR